MLAAERLRIALTGGIASGKTAVSDQLGQLGAAIIDTDVVAREVVAPGSEGLAAIRDAFGAEVIGADGSLDRARMRERVFVDPAARRALEAITHPRIRAACAAQAASATGDYLVFVVPLLVGSDFVAMVDRVLVVDCAREVQFARLMARDGETAEGARRILDAQSSREERLAIADDVIVNDADLDTLTRKVADVHTFYVASSRHPSFAKDRASAQN
ncbi:MAG: dephospho-CoA kinase [Pseudomonadota bacterium]